MISCAEFIPAYSELFCFLDAKEGMKGVKQYWDFRFNPKSTNTRLGKALQKEGLRGCYTYWSGTLNEEAADFTMYLNEPAGWFHLVMHHCPSKGRLLECQEEFGYQPYPHYCLHCDCYRYAIEQVGLNYIYNFSGTDRASCSILIYDPKVFNGQVIVDENTLVMDKKASDNAYFHPEFHNSLNAGVNYIGERFGKTGLQEFFRGYTQKVLGRTIVGIKERGLSALEELIRGSYEKENALDVLELIRTDKTLQVNVSACPAIGHIEALGYCVSPWYRYTTEMVMESLAESTNLSFTMDSYDEKTGKAQYHFVVK